MGAQNQTSAPNAASSPVLSQRNGSRVVDFLGRALWIVGYAAILRAFLLLRRLEKLRAGRAKI